MTSPHPSRRREPTVALVVRRTIKATSDRVFAAWTRPEQLRRWWGPHGIDCVGAEVDLRVGGAYRIGNRMPGGETVWIRGIFEVVDAPHRLVYTWTTGEDHAHGERVTVRFESTDAGTEVIVVHERIPDDATRAGHETGWVGCLDGLEAFVDRATSGQSQGRAGH